jgi:methionine biosynthesis protein MetW
LRRWDAFLEHLKVRGCPRVQGIDVDPEQVVRSVERGVDAIQGDLDAPDGFFADHSFDYVVLSRTLQVVRRPAVVVDEMLRVAKRGVISFPNFGYWRNRHQVSWSGRVPVTRNLPFDWADTPNLHHLSMRDFEAWCEARGIRILDRMAMDYESSNEIRWLPNLRATDAIYVITKE